MDPFNVPVAPAVDHLMVRFEYLITAHTMLVLMIEDQT